jgi:hypothetical protein
MQFRTPNQPRRTTVINIFTRRIKTPASGFATEYERLVRQWACEGRCPYDLAKLLDKQVTEAGSVDGRQMYAAWAAAARWASRQANIGRHVRPVIDPYDRLGMYGWGDAPEAPRIMQDNHLPHAIWVHAQGKHTTFQGAVEAFFRAYQTAVENLLPGDGR